MIQIEYLPLVLTGIGIIASILYYTFTLRNQTKIMQPQFFMQQFLGKNTSQELQQTAFEMMQWEWKDFPDFQEKYMLNPKTMGQFVSFWLLWDGLGIMLKEKYIPSELLFELEQGGMAPMMYWTKFGPTIKKIREITNNPDNFKYAEYYVMEMMKMRTMKGLPMEIESPMNLETE